jgi:hypothetical protein
VQPIFLFVCLASALDFHKIWREILETSSCDVFHASLKVSRISLLFLQRVVVFIASQLSFDVLARRRRCVALSS